MTGIIPSWAVKGAKVVCIAPFTHRDFDWERLPVVGAAYTIRSVHVMDDGVYIRLKEVRNRLWYYDCGGFSECRFWVEKFRPIVSGEQDDETEAKLYHKKGHRATRRTGIDA